MEKYRKAFEYHNRLVQKYIIERGMTEEEARNSWWALRTGIIEVAIHDDEITPEQFNEILEWGFKK